MSELFIRILNMSISASWVILAVVLMRILLKNSPKWVFVILWGIAAVRLLCPFSVESTLSLIPSAQTISPAILMDTTPTLQTGIPVVNDAVNSLIAESNLPNAGASVNPLQVTFAVGAVIWLIGIAVMLIYAATTYLLLRIKVKTAIRLKDNIYQCEHISTPFVLGVFRPEIYLSFTVRENNLPYVIAHEKTHISRRDHLWKPLGYCLLTVHWFNPFVWLAYILLCRDIELACDEKVIRPLGAEERADYSAALLSCSIDRKFVTACPVAFGEVGIKTRVRSALSYKRPALWLIALAVIVCTAVAVCFLTNPIGTSGEPDLSLLNYENAASYLMGTERVQVIYCPPAQKGADNAVQIGVADGNELAKFLDSCEWRVVNKPAIALSSPGSVEFVIQNDYRITVYDRKGGSLSGYAVVEMDGESRYYRIDRGDYQEAVDLLEPAGSENYDNRYYLMIGAEGVSEIQVITPDGSEIQYNTLKLPYRKGQQIRLEGLDGYTDLRGVSVKALSSSGEVLYVLSVPENVSNEEIINMVAADGWLLAPAAVLSAEENGQYYHIICCEGVAELKLSGKNYSGGCAHADGSAFTVGEKVWLQSLNSSTDLHEVTVSALDKDGNLLYSFLLVLENAPDQTVEALGWNGGLDFSDLKPNEEMTSAFEIHLDEEKNAVEYSINWSRLGLYLEYGVRSADGMEYYSGKEGGHDNGVIENIPAGTYRLFVRNTDYSGVPAYERPDDHPDVSFNAVGAINYRIQQ